MLLMRCIFTHGLNLSKGLNGMTLGWGSPFQRWAWFQQPKIMSAQKEPC